MPAYVLPKQIYTFVRPDGTNVHVDSDGLRRWCHSAKPPPEIFNILLDAGLAAGFLRDNVVSTERLIELACRLGELTPLIFAKDGSFGTNGDPNVMLVDGHHRYVLYAFAGLTFAPGFVLEPAQWGPFEIKCEWLNTTDAELKAHPVPRRDY